MKKIVKPKPSLQARGEKGMTTPGTCEKIIPGGYNDPDAKGNSPKYHTGKKCITEGCENPAGTAWSKHWCFECNVKRIGGISNSLESLTGLPTNYINDKVSNMARRKT